MNAFVSILAIAAAILMIAGWWKLRADQKKGKKSKGIYLLIAPATVLMVLYIVLAIGQRNQPIVQETPDERSCIITGDLTGIDFRNPVIEVLDYWHRDSVLARANVENGKFTVVVKDATAPTHVYLYCSNSEHNVQVRDFLLEPGEIHLTGDVNKDEDMGRPVSGLPLNDRWVKLKTDLSNATDSAAKMNVFETFLQDKPEEALILMALEEHINEIAPDRAMEVFDNIQGPLRNAEYAQLSFREYIQEMIRRNSILAKGAKFTDVAGQTPEGDLVHLSDFVGKGTPVLVDYWGSWCAPCIEGLPELAATAKKYAGRLKVVGVNVREGLRGKKLQDFLQKHGVGWDIIVDVNGQTSDYIRAVPQAVLLDGDGHIIVRAHPQEILPKLDEYLSSR